MWFVCVSNVFSELLGMLNVRLCFFVGPARAGRCGEKQPNGHDLQQIVKNSFRQGEDSYRKDKFSCILLLNPFTNCELATLSD